MFKENLGSCTPIYPMSHLLLLVSLKLNLVTKVNVPMCVVEEKARAKLSRENSEELAILKLEINAVK